MKTRIRLALASLSAASVLVALPGRAVPVVNYTAGTNNAYSVNGSDLLQSSVTSVDSSGSFTNEGTGGYGVLTDGLIGMDHASRAGIGSGSELTYHLDLTTHTGGYDLTALNIYSSWGDSGRVDADVVVSYSTRANPNVFIPLTTVTSSTGGFPDPWTESNIVNVGGGDLLDHVAALRFDFPTQQNGYVGYAEIDAIGTGVTIPEPSTVASLLLGLGALAFFVRRAVRV